MQQMMKAANLLISFLANNFRVPKSVARERQKKGLTVIRLSKKS
jgi:isopenicillin N synthase-like dioxygenase